MFLFKIQWVGLVRPRRSGGQNSELVRQKKTMSLTAILDDIATEGTLTRTGLDILRSEGAIDHWPETAEKLMRTLARDHAKS